MTETLSQPNDVSMQTLISMSSEYNNFVMAYSCAGSALQNVISVGTVIFNDPSFPLLFPNSWQNFQTYLQDLQAAINIFIQELPVQPPLDG